MPFSSRGASRTVAKAAIGDKVASATGSGAINLALPAAHHMKVLSIQLHLDSSSATNERLIVCLDSEQGEAFDAVLVSESMKNVTDVAVTDQFYIAQGDVLKIQFSNPTAAVYGLKVLYTDG